MMDLWYQDMYALIRIHLINLIVRHETEFPYFNILHAHARAVPNIFPLI